MTVSTNKVNGKRFPLGDKCALCNKPIKAGEYFKMVAIQLEHFDCAQSTAKPANFGAGIEQVPLSPSRA